MNTATHLRVAWPQRKLLTARELYPGDPANNLVQLWRVDGRLDVGRTASAFETCLDQMVAAKVNFERIDGQYVQVLEPARRVRCRLENFAAGEEDVLAARALAVAREWAGDPFDLNSWPLVRVTLFCTGADVRYVVFAMPHVICDAYSAYTLFDAIAAQYRAGDQTSPGPNELFGDYLSGLESDAPEVVVNPRAVEHFRRQLKDVPTLTHGAMSQVRDASGRLPGRLVAVTVDGERAERIRAYVHDGRTSEHALFLAAYCLLLGRLTGEQRVVTGLPVATRSSLNDIGYHVNTLPLSVALPEDLPFLDLCRRMQALTYEALRFRRFDYFHRDAAPLKGALNNAFTFQKSPITIAFDGCRLVAVPVDSGYVPFDFDLVVESLRPLADGYRCKFHLSAWFESIDVTELFTGVLDQVLLRPELPLGEVTLGTEEALRRFYAELNQYRPLAEPRPLHELFTAAAAQWPDRTALSHDTGALSYAELDRRSDRIAAALLKRCPDASKVAVWMTRGIDPVVCVLGVLKAGKAYVPIDPNAPVPRLRLILEGLGDDAVVACDDTRAHMLAAEAVTVLTIRELDEAGRDTSESFAPPRIDVDRHAYLVYTSGSTGAPKGVVITHRNVANFLARLQDEHGYLPSDVWAQCGSLAFDISVWEIFGCLLSGGRLVLTSADQARTPQALYRLVQEEGVTILAVTPTTFGGFQREDHARREPLPLRCVYVGGEPFHASQLSSWVERHPLTEIPIFNCYGITETTVLTCSHRVTPADLARQGLGVVGRPWAHARVYVVDGHLRPLPRGVPGELVIHGDAVSSGYFRRYDLTAQRFVTSELLGENLIVYRSGDLVRVTRDLEMEFMGRMDQQVQLHGFRVELGEIAAAIGPLISPATCHVCMIQRTEGVDQLAAFVVGHRSREELAELRVAVKRVLPGYMVPDYLVSVPGLPLTVNGKVDTSALLEYLPRTEAGRVADAAGPTEAFIQSRIAEAVCHNDFTRDDNFFDIGLNSVHIVDVYEALLRRYPGIRLRMTDLFLYTTVATLAEYVEGPVAAPAGPSAVDRSSTVAGAGESQGAARRQALLEAAGGRS